MEYYPNLILDALRHVIHPAKEKDIVSLGMVEDDIRIDGKRISFSLLFDRANDPMANSIKNAAIQAIKTYVDKDAQIDGNVYIKIKPRQQKETSQILPEVSNIIAIASGKGDRKSTRLNSSH